VKSRYWIYVEAFRTQNSYQAAVYLHVVSIRVCVCVCVPISLRRLGGQPAVGASAQSVVLTASHSSFIEVPSTGVCVCVCVHVCVWQV